MRTGFALAGALLIVLAVLMIFSGPITGTSGYAVSVNGKGLISVSNVFFIAFFVSGIAFLVFGIND